MIGAPGPPAWKDWANGVGTRAGCDGRGDGVIVTDLPGGILLVRQRDHAEQCAQLAEAWGNDTFRRIAPWGPLVRATRIHDDGWEPWDAAPQVDGTGRPVDFPTLDRRRHVVLYRAGIAAACDAGPRVGLVVSLHGQGLYEKRMGLDGPVPERSGRPLHEVRFIEDQERLQARLRAELPAAGLPEWERTAYLLLQAWDVLSLYLCWGGLHRGQRWLLNSVPRGPGDEGVTIRLEADGDDTCVVDPWPFDRDRIVTSVAGVRVPSGPYRDDDALRAAIEAAVPEQVSATLRPR